MPSQEGGEATKWSLKIHVTPSGLTWSVQPRKRICRQKCLECAAKRGFQACSDHSWAPEILVILFAKNHWDGQGLCSKPWNSQHGSKWSWLHFLSDCLNISEEVQGWKFDLGGLFFSSWCFEDHWQPESIMSLCPFVLWRVTGLNYHAPCWIPLILSKQLIVSY